MVTISCIGHGNLTNELSVSHSTSTAFLTIHHNAHSNCGVHGWLESMAQFARTKLILGGRERTALHAIYVDFCAQFIVRK
jgi:hypothetical protein